MKIKLSFIILFLLISFPSKAGMDFTKISDGAMVTTLANGSKVLHLGEIAHENPMEKGYSILYTPLAEIQNMLEFNIIQYIVETLAEQKYVIILDWGCGGAEALNEIAKMCRHANIVDNVKLYGLSNLYFSQWKRNDPMITYIYGDKSDLIKYQLERFDLVFSHYGLYHLVPRENLVKHMNEFRSMLNPGGVIIYNNCEYDPLALIDLTYHYHLDYGFSDFGKWQKLTLKQNGSMIFIRVISLGKEYR